MRSSCWAGNSFMAARAKLEIPICFSAVYTLRAGRRMRIKVYIVCTLSLEFWSGAKSKLILVGSRSLRVRQYFHRLNIQKNSIYLFRIQKDDFGNVSRKNLIAERVQMRAQQAHRNSHLSSFSRPIDCINTFVPLTFSKSSYTIVMKNICAFQRL